jgi:hypothetical protein
MALVTTVATGPMLAVLAGATGATAAVQRQGK